MGDRLRDTISFRLSPLTSEALQDIFSSIEFCCPEDTPGSMATYYLPTGPRRIVWNPPIRANAKTEHPCGGSKTIDALIEIAMRYRLCMPNYHPSLQ